MTKTEILHSLSEQIARQYRLHGLYRHEENNEAAERALERVWSIYWCGLDLLGDSYMDKLYEIKDNARQAATAYVKLVKNL